MPNTRIKPNGECDIQLSTRRRLIEALPDGAQDGEVLVAVVGFAALVAVACLENPEMKADLENKTGDSDVDQAMYAAVEALLDLSNFMEPAS